MLVANVPVVVGSSVSTVTPETPAAGARICSSICPSADGSQRRVIRRATALMLMGRCVLACRVMRKGGADDRSPYAGFSEYG